MTSQQTCKYGANCYRKNAKHLKDFSHPDVDSSNDRENESEIPGDNKHDRQGITHQNPDSSDGRESTSHIQERKRKNEDARAVLRKTSTDVKQNKTLCTYFTDEKTKVDLGDDDGQNSVKGSEALNDLSDDDALVAALESVESTSADNAVGECSILSIEDAKRAISELYRVGMPEDLYAFWQFCQGINADNPADSLKSLGLHLVGPYDILAGRKPKKNVSVNYLVHWRYYYDPPEFTTILADNNARQFHMGYFRDDPADGPVFVASNTASENCSITPRGENIFAAVKWYLEDKYKKSKEKSISRVLTQLCDYAKEHKFSLDAQTAAMKARQKNVVCKTFHGAGLVVPVDKHDVGYRPVPETPADLKKMLKRIVEAPDEDARLTFLEPLEEIITFVQFANDECDYGEGVELGLDLFSYGGEVLHPFVQSLLCLGYKLLKRDLYGEVIKEFLKVRRKDKPFNVLTG